LFVTKSDASTLNKAFLYAPGPNRLLRRRSLSWCEVEG
jgi:hypothetical protein